MSMYTCACVSGFICLQVSYCGVCVCVCMCGCLNEHVHMCLCECVLVCVCVCVCAHKANMYVVFQAMIIRE
jgi:hypothetical protein